MTIDTHIVNLFQSSIRLGGLVLMVTVILLVFGVCAKDSSEKIVGARSEFSNFEIIYKIRQGD